VNANTLSKNSELYGSFALFFARASMQAVYGTYRKQLFYVAGLALAPVVGLALGLAGVLFLQPAPDLKDVVDTYSLGKPRPIRLEVIKDASSPSSALLELEAMVPARAVDGLNMEVSLRIGQQPPIGLGTISIGATPVVDGLHHIAFSKDVLDFITNNRGVIKPETFSNSFVDAQVISNKRLPYGQVYITRASLELTAGP
jgi:hypothetical protein